MSFILLRMMSKCAPQCFPGCFKQICERKAKEVKEPHEKHLSFYKAITEKIDLVKDNTDKEVTKQGFQERRLMLGQQGYRPEECLRQITNAFEEWNYKRSEFYFTSVVVSEFSKWANATGGRCVPKGDLWR